MLTLFLIFLGYSGLGISLWPHIVPPAISIWEAAAPPQSLGFTLVGALLIIPMILGLHRVVLLRVPRQGRRDARLPLMEHDAARPNAARCDPPAPRGWWRRVAWLVALWAASVAALGVVAYAFRAIMGWVGLTR